MNEGKTTETAEGGLEVFHQEIAGLKGMEERGETTSGHLLEVNTGELTKADMRMWHKIRDCPLHGEITKDDKTNYRADVEQSGSVSRGRFREFLNNKLSILVMQAELERQNKLKGKNGK